MLLLISPFKITFEYLSSPILAALPEYQAVGNLVLENVLVVFVEEGKSNCIVLVSAEGLHAVP